MGSIDTAQVSRLSRQVFLSWRPSYQTLNDFCVLVHLPATYHFSLHGSSTEASLISAFFLHCASNSSRQSTAQVNRWMDEFLTQEANVKRVLIQRVAETEGKKNLVENENPRVLWTWKDCPGCEWQPTSPTPSAYTEYPFSEMCQLSLVRVRRTALRKRCVIATS